MKWLFEKKMLNLQLEQEPHLYYVFSRVDFWMQIMCCFAEAAPLMMQDNVFGCAIRNLWRVEEKGGQRVKSEMGRMTVSVPSGKIPRRVS